MIIRKGLNSDPNSNGPDKIDANRCLKSIIQCTGSTCIFCLTKVWKMLILSTSVFSISLSMTRPPRPPERASMRRLTASSLVSSPQSASSSFSPQSSSLPLAASLSSSEPAFFFLEPFSLRSFFWVRDSPYKIPIR